MSLLLPPSFVKWTKKFDADGVIDLNDEPFLSYLNNFIEVFGHILIRQLWTEAFEMKLEINDIF